MLARQRIGIQLAYVREKLAFGFGSAETRTTFARAVSWTLTIATILLTKAVAILLATYAEIGDIVPRVIVGIIAFLGVLSIANRVIIGGIGAEAALARYKWYRAALNDLQGRFNNPAPTARLAVLRDVEELSYRELREFLVQHNGADFNFT